MMRCLTGLVLFLGGLLGWAFALPWALFIRGCELIDKTLERQI